MERQFEENAYGPYNASVVKHALKKLQPHVYSQRNYFKFLDTWSPLYFLECTSLVAAVPCITAAPASWLLTFGSTLTGVRNPFPSLIPPALRAFCEPESLHASLLVLQWSLFVSLILLTPLSVASSLKSLHWNHLETAPFPAGILTHALIFCK